MRFNLAKKYHTPYTGRVTPDFDDEWERCNLLFRLQTFSTDRVKKKYTCSLQSSATGADLGLATYKNLDDTLTHLRGDLPENTLSPLSAEIYHLITSGLRKDGGVHPVRYLFSKLPIRKLTDILIPIGVAPFGDRKLDRYQAGLGLYQSVMLTHGPARDDYRVNIPNNRLVGKEVLGKSGGRIKLFLTLAPSPEGLTPRGNGPTSSKHTRSGVDVVDQAYVPFFTLAAEEVTPECILDETIARCKRDTCVVLANPHWREVAAIELGAIPSRQNVSECVLANGQPITVIDSFVFSPAPTWAYKTFLQRGDLKLAIPPLMFSWHEEEPPPVKKSKTIHVPDISQATTSRKKLTLSKGKGGKR